MGTVMKTEHTFCQQCMCRITE